MDGHDYNIQWVEEIANPDIVQEEVITIHSDQQDSTEYLVTEEIIPSNEINSITTNIDHIAAENLIYMAQDGHVTEIGGFINEQNVRDEHGNCHAEFFECQVTEEVITDDWVLQQGEERVEIPVYQLNVTGNDNQLDEEIEVPLPTDQDEYTALRPYPCDFCSRRFRKKATLMSHMIAHRNDPAFACNFCGSRYVRRSELICHLKSHAHLDTEINDIIMRDDIDTHSFSNYDNQFQHTSYIKSKHKKKKRNPYEEEEEEEEDNLSNSQIGYESQDIKEKFEITNPSKPFVCQQCGVAFAREKAMLSHSRIHGTDSPYECLTCNEMFWSLDTLNEHQRLNHFEASNSEYEPENDDETESENDSKYGDFYCNLCGMSFHRKDLLKRHMKSHVKEEIIEKDTKNCCNVCKETFSGPLELLAHAEVHARIQPYKCVLCGETFFEEATIMKHVSTVHAAEIHSNSCKVCGKQCRNIRSLMKHAWEHSTEKNQICSKCGKTFHNKTRLKRHMVSHRNKTVTCNICQEEFPDGRSLMNHRHSHSSTPGKLFPCHDCGKIFGSRSSQQIHIRIHTGERPYGCKYCWKAFADGGTLRKHERIHTGEKPYVCAVCPRAFNQRVVLREHIRSLHSTPDRRHGTSQLPFYCSVCTDLFVSSQELIKHLIHHSDLNTALHRQPVTGPRKYKRRRKLKPHELERLNTESVGIDNSDFEDLEDIMRIDRQPKNNRHVVSTTSTISSVLAPRNRKFSNNSDKTSANSWQQKFINSATNDETMSNSMLNNVENTLKNLDSLVVSNNNSSNSPGSVNKIRHVTRRKLNIRDKNNRPKMIHTEKKRVQLDEGRRKCKTMITRTDTIDVGENVIPDLDKIKTEFPNGSNSSTEQEQESTKIFTNQKKSNSMDMKLLMKNCSAQEGNNNHSDVEPSKKSQTKTKVSSLKKNYENDDCRRSNRRSAANKKYIDFETSIKSLHIISEASKKRSQKSKNSVVEIQEKNNINLNIKTESESDDQIYQCEMCSEVFAERSMLLLHVPIHI